MDIQDLDDVVELASVGENDPPAAHGSRGTAHITGPDPTGKWEGNPNALALDTGDGSFEFKDAAEMKKHLYFWEDALQTWDGAVLAPLTGADEGGGGEAGASLPTGTDGSLLIHDATGWVAFPPPPFTPATYGLRYIVQAGAVPGMFSWGMVTAEDPEGGATRRQDGPGYSSADPTRKPDQGDARGGAPGGRDRSQEGKPERDPRKGGR